jgi:hypothetical protein
MLPHQAVHLVTHQKDTYEPHNASTHLKAIIQAGLPQPSPPDIHQSKILSFHLLSVSPSLSHPQGISLRPSISERIPVPFVWEILMHAELKRKRPRERSCIRLSMKEKNDVMRRRLNG